MNDQNFTATPDRFERAHNQLAPPVPLPWPIKALHEHWDVSPVGEPRRRIRVHQAVTTAAQANSRAGLSDIDIILKWLAVELGKDPLPGEIELILSAVWDKPEHVGSENASEVTPPLAEHHIGHALADARIDLWHSTSWEELIRVVRDYLPIEFVQQLTQLHGQPFDPDQGEEPLNFESVRWFIDYCLRRAVKRRPLMTVTPDGVIQGNWHKDKTNRVTIRFFPNGLAWISIRTAMTRGSFEVPTQFLLTERSPVKIPKWAR